MQTSGRLAAVTVSLALLSAVPATSIAAPSADAREGTSWTTIGKFGGAKHQACATLVDKGTTWRIKNRLVNGNKGRVGAGMIVQKNGVDTHRTWSTGLIPKRTTSKVGSVDLPADDSRFTLVSYEHQSQAGNGGPIALADIGPC